MIINKQLPDPIKPHCKELTSNEWNAVYILYDRCLKDPELREVMSSIRGAKPENIIKHYFRSYHEQRERSHSIKV